LRDEIVGMVVFSLIENSEICGTRILAEDIVNKQRQKIGSEEASSDAEHALKLLNNALREAREMSHRMGPLVGIKVDGKYYTEVKAKKPMLASKRLGFKA
jgi:hypothetical protein